MSQIKNNEGISSHLKRIFIYGDEGVEDARVHSFLAYLAERINPFTGRPYELGGRSLYRYIGGEMQFPVDLLPPLVSWSQDIKLMEAYNIYPAPGDEDRLLAKIEAEEEEIKKRLDRVALMKERLRVGKVRKKVRVKN